MSRKHGPFDTRWPSAHTDSPTAAAALALDPAEAAEALDWDAFSTRYFPRRGRHDSQAQSAYANYKHGHEWRSADRQGSRVLRLVPTQEPPAAPEGTGSFASREPS